MPLSVDGLIEKAKDQRSRKRYEESLVSALAAVEEEPENGDAWWQVSLSRIALGDRRGAITALKKTVELEPAANNAWTRLGNLFLDEELQDEAKEALTEALGWDEEDIDALEGMSRIYAAQDNPDQDDQEISVLERIARLNYLDSRQLNRLGNLHYRHGHLHEAIKYWREDVASSDSSASRFNIGLAYSRPEVSQDADAVDMWRITLSKWPDYEPPEKSLEGHLPRMLELAAKARRASDTLLPMEQWYEHYLNPFVLLNPPDDLDLGDFDPKTLQKLKKTLLQEIELEDGAVSWMPGVIVDKSRAIGLCEELNDDMKRQYHWIVYNDKPLLDFLSVGAHAHFLVDEHDFRLSVLESLEDENNGFRDWLGDIFAPQFDWVISKAIDAENFVLLECLLDGRRWVPPSLEDRCFQNARRIVDRLIQPLRDKNEGANATKPLLRHIERILNMKGLLQIMNLLPSFFEEFQNEAIHMIRGVAISCFNSHGDIDLSRQVIELAKRFHFRSAEANRTIELDVEQIEKLVRQERQHEVKLTGPGKLRWEITKEGLLKGDVFIATADVSSVRWGTILRGEQAAPEYDFLFAAGAEDGRQIVFQWAVSSGIEQQEKNFQNLISATLNYVFPALVERAEKILSSGQPLRIGPCRVTRQGIHFEVNGWFSSNEHLALWHQAQTISENGAVTVFDANNPKKKTTFSLRDTDNAPLLRILINIKNGRDG
jgi:cytochrome c-type biogenesis protein CcmH/NrfG